MTERSECLSTWVSEWLSEERPPIEDQGLVLFEESGELAEEILKLNGGKLYKDYDPDDRESFAAEVGDVAFTLWSIALLEGVDPMEQALIAAQRNVERAGDSDG